ncbi:MAG TPA: Stk1 family PASTA domain-containing Ser/Thr kinase [Rubrobacteraceae bacterium]|nr:Stk1 family PASTA domain-containing Ser/Thr kinase [Rubrobacteraceae bacterium]
MQQLVDNRYRIVRELGSGGMAEVYLAHDDVLDRDVALKVMSGRYADDDEFVERFRREAQSAAALSHPNIVSIYDRGASEDGTYYIAMEYLPGGTLKDRILKRGALQPRTAAAVTMQIAEALQVAHKHGVIHRDIKPHNILITESGDLKVTDFGIARAASSSTMTKTGSILGTAHYISPEQAMGEHVGPASDLYSLGVVLYEMLTGELPYDADTPIGIAMKHVNGHLRPPKAMDPSIPDGINAITVRLLAKDPMDRYGSAAELIEDLERFIAGRQPASATTQMMAAQTTAQTLYAPTRVGPPPSRIPERRKERRSIAPLLLILLALALLAPVAYATGLLGGSQDTPTRQPKGTKAPAKVKVPELTGLKLDEARRQYGDLKIVEDDRRESKEAVGTILEQDPASGEKVEKGSEVSVVVSGTQVADVPDVKGDQQDDARSALEDAGFKVKTEEKESSDADKGLIIEQDPEGGSTEKVGSEVTITVGTGPEKIKVPDIPYGATASEAQSLLESNGLVLGGQSSRHNGQIAKGGVIDQSPRPGAEVEPGSAVSITLSSGPKQIAVPDVVGQNVDVAKQAMVDAGLGYKSKEVQSNKPAGTVISTDPAAGTMLDPLTYVLITYSIGPPEQTTKPSPKPAPKPKPKQKDSGSVQDRIDQIKKDAKKSVKGG